MTPTEEAITELVVIVKDSKEFVLEQAPAVAREIVTYGKTLFFIGVGFEILLASIFFYCLVQFKEDGHHDSLAAIGGASAMLFIVVLVAMLGSNSIMPLIAPKLYILNELKCLVK